MTLSRCERSATRRRTSASGGGRASRARSPAASRGASPRRRRRAASRRVARHDDVAEEAARDEQPREQLPRAPRASRRDAFAFANLQPRTRAAISGARRARAGACPPARAARCPRRQSRELKDRVDRHWLDTGALVQLVRGDPLERRLDAAQVTQWRRWIGSRRAGPQTPACRRRRSRPRDGAHHTARLRRRGGAPLEHALVESAGRSSSACRRRGRERCEPA
jgi:hypothetical protein